MAGKYAKKFIDSPETCYKGVLEVAGDNMHKARGAVSRSWILNFLLKDLPKYILG